MKTASLYHPFSSESDLLRSILIIMIILYIILAPFVQFVNIKITCSGVSGYSTQYYRSSPDSLAPEQDRGVTKLKTFLEPHYAKTRGLSSKVSALMLFTNCNKLAVTNKKTQYPLLYDPPAHTFTAHPSFLRHSY